MRLIKQLGFTLIELMFVVAIIGILAAIAIPAYQDYVTRSKLTEAFVMVSEIKSTVNEYYKATGGMPVDNQQAGLAESGAYRGNYVLGVEVENGSIHVELDSQALSVKGKWFSLRPQTNEQVVTMDIIWACNKSGRIDQLAIHGNNRTDIQDKFLPSQCR